MKVAPRSASGSGPSTTRGDVNLSEEFTRYALVLGNEHFFTGIGDPFNDCCWDSPQRPTVAQDDIREHANIVRQDSFSREFLYEGGQVSVVDDVLPAWGTDLLVGGNLGGTSQDFHGWFDEMDLATQQLSPLSQ